jgi:ABC-type lipoprotein release transport system permease subunit
MAPMMLSTKVLLLGGVIRGLVPAMRASKPDPVEVLRYEYRRCRVIP